MRSHSPALRPLLLVPLLFAACADNEITTYRIPKEKEQDAASAAAHAHASAGVSAEGSSPKTASDSNMAGTAVPTASGTGLTWTAPAHWEARAGSAMRKATFVAKGEGGASAELAVTAFPGDVGGEVANVNRWRSQINLPPLPDAAVPAEIQRLETNGLPVAFVDMVNSTAASPVRVLGAWVPYEGSTWFFKMSGPEALVTREKPAFLAFLQTLKAANP